MYDLKEITVTVPGKPIGKGRPRTTKTGITYTPAKTRQWERAASVLAKRELAFSKPMQRPVEVFIVLSFSIPASWGQKRRAKALAGDIGHTTRPDADNAAKAALDALSGIVYRDDSQVTDLIVRKRYSETPQVQITVREINQESAQERGR